MRNYKIYIYITLSFVLIYILTVSTIIIPSISKCKNITLLQNTINLAQQEAQEIRILSQEGMLNKIDRKNTIENIQKAISNNFLKNTTYLTVFDWSGRVLCHPDATKIGEKNIEKSNAISNIKSTVTGKQLHELIQNNKEDLSSEIINLQPISNSDLIIATHVNINNIHTQIKNFKSELTTLFCILGLILLAFFLITIRLFSIYYEKIIENKTAKLEDGVLNLSKLNSSLENYQKGISELKERTEKNVIDKDEEIKEVPKQRLLTYIRNELMPIPIEDISYIYVENSITYVVRKDKKQFTANDSLDQIYSNLDSKLFFRANRQTIVAIYAINKIIKYGNSALKIEMQPTSEIDVIIGKNKVSSFKKWLDL